MLLKSQISRVLIHTDDWFSARLAKFTSSEFHYLMGEKGIGEAGLNYIYRKIGEELTGTPCRKEISTEATEHGHLYEPENLKTFAKFKGLVDEKGDYIQDKLLVGQTLVLCPTGRVGSTPDAMIALNESVDKLQWNVETVEAKCPTAYDAFIHLWNCKTPADIKKKKKEYFWQVCHQMKVAGALRGYLSIYNPFFKVGQLNVIEFRKIDLVPEFTLMEQRTQEAIKIFTEQRDKMIAE